MQYRMKYLRGEERSLTEGRDIDTHNKRKQDTTCSHQGRYDTRGAERTLQGDVFV